MNSKIKIMLASACGAAIGYGLATTFLTGIWTLVAALIGSVAGWAVFDLRGLGKSLINAFTVTLDETSTWLRETWAEPWGGILLAALKYAALPILTLLPIASAAFYVTLLLLEKVAWMPLLLALCIPMTISLLAAVVIFVGVLSGGRQKRRELLEPGSEHRVPFGPRTKAYILLASPLGFPFTVLFVFIWIVFWTFKKILRQLRCLPVITKFCWLVTVRTCVLAHNNGRFACAVGGGMGTLIGIAMEHVIVAMATGAAIGVFIPYIGAFFSKGYVALLMQQLEDARGQSS